MSNGILCNKQGKNRPIGYCIFLQLTSATGGACLDFSQTRGLDLITILRVTKQTPIY